MSNLDDMCEDLHEVIVDMDHDWEDLPLEDGVSDHLTTGKNELLIDDRCLKCKLELIYAKYC